MNLCDLTNSMHKLISQLLNLSLESDKQTRLVLLTLFCCEISCVMASICRDIDRKFMVLIKFSYYKIQHHISWLLSSKDRLNGKRYFLELQLHAQTYNEVFIISKQLTQYIFTFIHCKTGYQHHIFYN